jgi:predicted ATPase/DNA-binding CsgD family transcriptional regulator
MGTGSAATLRVTVPALSHLGNLPSETSSFVGRGSELRRLIKLQATARLLSLVGPGGCGKTRVALRIARQRMSAFGGRVWYVDVALRAGQWEAIARDLRVSADGATLLVLETCDADITASAQLVTKLLGENPMLQILATSREPLGVSNEVVGRVPLLSLPVGGPSLKHLRTGDANRLLDNRVSATVSDATNSRDMSAISCICRNLNGLPLAIEMAALQLGSLGPKVVAEQTQTAGVLELLGRRDAPLRQRSLRATLDWSYSRLTDSERHVLTRVSVFAAAWTVDMALAVCGDIAPSDLTEIVRALVQKSLVHPVKRGAGRRFELLQMTRWYGRQILANRGDLDGVRRSHLEWCLSVAEARLPEGLDRRHARRLEREREDLRLALEWAVRSRETELGLRLATATFTLWQLHGVSAETPSWLQHLLAQPLEGVRPEVVRRALACRARLLLLHGDFGGAETLVGSVLAQQKARRDALGTGLWLVLLANTLLLGGQLDRATEVCAEAQLVLGGVNDPAFHGLPLAIYLDARVAWELSETERTRALTQRLIGFSRSRQTVLLSRANQLQGLIAAEDGDWPAAQHYLGEAERLLRRNADTLGFVDLLTDRARVLLLSGDTIAAHHAFVDAASLARTIRARSRLIRAIEGVACTLADTRPVLCVKLAAAAAASRQAMHAAAWPRDRALLEAALAKTPHYSGDSPDATVTDLGSASYSEVWRIGAMQFESEAADAAIRTLDVRPPAVIADVPARLTSREWEVAQLFARGVSARQIAERLALSRDTVRTHLDRATAKLGVHSRVQLVTWVVQSRAASHPPPAV